MKIRKLLSPSIIALLIITVLISACAGATSAEVKPPVVQTAPAQPTDAPKPTAVPQPAFDLSANVS